MAREATTKREPRPTQTVVSMREIGRLVASLRHTLDVSQADLAVRAHVGRQWIVAMEQGKPGLEVALVLRTLDALGLGVTLTPQDPLPPWIFEAKRAAEAARAEVRRRRNARRRVRRAGGSLG